MTTTVKVVKRKIDTYFPCMKDATLFNLVKASPSKKTFEDMQKKQRDVVMTVSKNLMDPDSKNNKKGVDKDKIYDQTLKVIWDMENKNNGGMLKTLAKLEKSATTKPFADAYKAMIELQAKRITSSICESVRDHVNKLITLGQCPAQDKVVTVREPSPSKRMWLRTFKSLDKKGKETYAANRVVQAERLAGSLGLLLNSLYNDINKFKETAIKNACPNMELCADYQKENKVSEPVETRSAESLAKVRARMVDNKKATRKVIVKKTVSKK